MYYLQSRYYDPAIGRFINADCYASTGQGFVGCNMFAYCNNNPINYNDPDGCFVPPLIIGLIAVPVILLATIAFISDPQFQYAVSQVQSSTSNLRHTISIAIPKIPGLHCESAEHEMRQAINQSYSAVTVKPSYKHPIEDHHIVAQNDFRALFSYSILNELGINVITDPDNHVFLSTGFHRRLHSNAYYFWVNNQIGKAYMSAAKLKSLQTIAVRAELIKIKTTLTLLNQAMPF